MSAPAWAAVGVGVVAAAAGWYAAINAARTLRRQFEDSRERSRPMVVAELRDHPHADATQMLVVCNHGPTVARNVEVRFEPRIPDPENPAESMTSFLKRRYSRPIPVLTPGMELDNIWFSGEPHKDGWRNHEPIPDEVIAYVAYDAPDGSRYEESFLLDVSVIRGRTYTVSSRDPTEQAKRAIKILDAIEDHLATIARQAQSD